jgi:hypothetical protein
MKFVWEVLITALGQGVSREDLRFRPDINGSPYFETAFEDLNAETLWDATVEVNPLSRFAHVLSKLFDPDLEAYKATRELLFDAFMHYQGQLDLRQGFTKSEYYIRSILRDLLSGTYGESHGENCKLFTNEQMKNILRCLLTLHKTGTSLELFRKALRPVYPQTLIYRNNNAYREILIYIPWEKNGEDMRKLDFIVSMFLDINYTVYVFWKHHFGIIGVDETLEYGDSLIF